MSYIIGISAYYHDSAITLIKDGEILFSIEEEKFSRLKHDKEFPAKSLSYCLKLFDIDLSDISHFIFYDKPLTKFERLLETYVSFAPFGWKFYKASLPEWFNGKIFLEKKLRKSLEEIDPQWSGSQSILFCEHHLSHASSAFYPSPYSSSAILCLDGVGEWDTASAWIGNGNEIEKLWSIEFPHSIGLLYSAFTYYLGFEVNNGEYKMMGLSPYGDPKYSKLIEDKLIDIKKDGSFRLNMDYFSFATDIVMTNEKFSDLFDHRVRKSSEKIEQFHMDIAASIQKTTEKIVLLLAQSLRDETGLDSLCLAGGVALNCVANGKLKESNIFKNIWIQPAAGDSGGSLGAALSCWYQYLGNERIVGEFDSMKGSLLGPSYSNTEIEEVLASMNCVYSKVENVEELTAREISEGKVIGWFQGRAEYGPRALGNRSILGDPRSKDMQRKLNLNIKYRESFRPFAPAVLEERVSDFFNFNGVSPYMLFTSKVLNASYKSGESSDLFEKLSCVDSKLPAITHVDLSARIQTVSSDTNDKFRSLISEFDKITKIPVLINTSFNIRGEPIVLTPENAINCFMNTEMDTLVVGDYILYKEEQKKDSFEKYSTGELGQVDKEKKVVSSEELKTFGYQITFIFSVVIGLILPWGWNYKISLIPFILGGVTILLRFIFLRGLIYFYYPWQFIFNVLTYIKAKILLSLSYFFLISPIGIFMRLIGKDPMSKKFDNDETSYLKRSEDEKFDPTSLKYPF